MGYHPNNPVKTFPNFTAIFVVFFVLEILGLTVIPEFHMVSKVLIMASLISFYILNAKGQDSIFLLGLIFALVGDAFLLFNGSHFFLIGLGAFLVMQICYSYYFNQQRRIPKTVHYIVPALYSLLAVAVVWRMKDSLPFKPIFLFAYAGALVLMVSFAYLRHNKLNAYWQVFLGANLFLISDALLGVNAFVKEFQYADLAVMITYMLAQYLIVTGVVQGRMRIPKAEGPKRDSHFTIHKT